MEKKCYKCGNTKSIDNFHKKSKSKDGRQPKCKTCACEATRKNYLENIEDRRESKKEYGKKNAKAIYEKNKNRFAKNATKYLEYCKKYRDLNKEKEKERARKYRESHKNEALEYRRKYREINREKLNLWDANRAAREKKATPKWANSFYIAEAYSLRIIREFMTNKKWHVDHIVPISSDIVCGLHVEQNLQVIPASLNQRKSNRYWPDMPD